MSDFSVSLIFILSSVIVSLFIELSHHCYAEPIYMKKPISLSAHNFTLFYCPPPQLNETRIMDLKMIAERHAYIISWQKKFLLNWSFTLQISVLCVSFTCLFVCLCVAAVWCSAGKLWCDFLRVAASATAMTRQMTWCWACASMLLDFLSHIVLSSTRL